MTKAPKVRVGDVAPDFTLPDQTGTPVRLRDLVGRKTVVLYFYPKDQTPGCTVEARAVRDSYDAFTAGGAGGVGGRGASGGARPPRWRGCRARSARSRRWRRGRARRRGPARDWPRSPPAPGDGRAA